MSADRDMTRIVRSWLRTDEHESAARVLDTVLAQLDATPQRRPRWPARRIADMNMYARIAVAAVVVLAAAALGYALLPSGGTVVSGGGASPTVAPSVSSPSPSPSPSPSLLPAPSVVPGAIPPAGVLPAGRYSFSQGGVPFSLELPTSDWTSSGVVVPPDGGTLEKNVLGNADGAWILIWGVDGVYADPCHRLPAPVAGPSAADLADAVLGIPDLDVSAPKDVTVGRYQAKLLTVDIPDRLPCGTSQFQLWYDDGGCGPGGPCGRWVSETGSTIRILIVDVGGKRVWIEAETYRGAPPEVGAEIDRIIGSIDFG